MSAELNYDVIIIGGSYSGLSAALALGRGLRKVLVIDGGKPCNINTPFSHNFILHEGETPKQISAKAKEQVLRYKTVTFLSGLVTNGCKTKNGFEIGTESNEKFYAKKIIFATGIKDILPRIKNFKECWGITALHCPYCHGYEMRNEETGVLANGALADELARSISNWTDKLTVFTNGKSQLSPQCVAQLKEHGVKIVEKEIDALEHENGKMKNVIFKDGTKQEVHVLYSKPLFEQQFSLPEDLGCQINEHGLIKVDVFQKTNISGVFACGDNSTLGRTLSLAIATGTVAGMFCNKEIIEDLYKLKEFA